MALLRRLSSCRSIWPFCSRTVIKGWRAIPYIIEATLREPPLALSIDKVGVVSTMQIGKNICFFFALSSTCPFTAPAVKAGCTSRIKINKFILYSLRFALFTASTVKVGCTSRIKINKFILYSLRFALPLDKVGGVSTMQIRKNICFFFALSSTCTTFVTY